MHGSRKHEAGCLPHGQLDWGICNETFVLFVQGSKQSASEMRPTWSGGPPSSLSKRRALGSLQHSATGRIPSDARALSVIRRRATAVGHLHVGCTSEAPCLCSPQSVHAGLIASAPSELLSWHVSGSPEWNLRGPTLWIQSVSNKLNKKWFPLSLPGLS